MTLTQEFEQTCRKALEVLNESESETPEAKWAMKKLEVAHEMMMKEEEMVEDIVKHRHEEALEERRLSVTEQDNHDRLKADEQSRKSKSVKEWVVDTAKIVVPAATGTVLMILGWNFERHDTYGSRSDQRVSTALKLGQSMK